VLFRARALFALVFLLISPLSGSAAPVLAARAWLLLDATSGIRLAAQEPTARHEPASLTKLMTAYVVYTAIGEKRIALDDTVKVSRAAFAAPGKAGRRMYIEPDRPVTVEELLKGLLVVSGNDAAVARRAHGRQRRGFCRPHAPAAQRLMINTRFANWLARRTRRTTRAPPTSRNCRTPARRFPRTRALCAARVHPQRRDATGCCGATPA
jgi:D-alanyl-D-alanine carboxypeptidase (penicillin-binding protein 5/6)